MSKYRRTMQKTGKPRIPRRHLTVLLVSILVVVSIALYYVLTQTRVDGVEETPRALRIVVSMATITCEHIEFNESLIYMRGACKIKVSVLNNENETITVHGIVVFYNGMDKRVSIPVTNVTVEPGRAVRINGSFVLPENTLVFDGSRVFIRAFLRIEYLGKYYSLPVELSHIGV